MNVFRHSIVRENMMIWFALVMVMYGKKVDIIGLRKMHNNILYQLTLYYLNASFEEHKYDKIHRECLSII